MSKAMSSDPVTPSPRIEVITSVQRRRRWSTAEKVRLVESRMASTSIRTATPLSPEGETPMGSPG